MTRARAAGLAIVVLIAAIACDRDGDASPETYTVRDSAGIAIVENRLSEAESPAQHRLAAEPSLQIGSAEGPEEYQLHRVAGAIRLSDGSIVVANAGAGELRWYGPDGDHLATAGRSGAGPGEFRFLSWIGRAPADTVIAWDRELRRISVLVGGRFVRDAPMEIQDELPFPEARGILNNGSILVIPGPRYAPEDLPGVQRPSLPVWRLDTSGRSITTLGPFSGAAVLLKPAATPGAWLRTEVPFGPKTVIAAARDHVVVADNGSYEFRIHSADGRLLRIVRADLPARRVTEADLEAELERRLAAAPPVDWIRDGIRASFRETPAAETIPPYDAVVGDSDGNLWVRRTSHESNATVHAWDLFDPDGRWLGWIDIPSSLVVTEIGSDYLLGVWKDELEVEYVRMYRLIRAGA